MKTHYEILEISESASQEVVQGAYRFLAQKWHPDKHPDDIEAAREKMQEINSAYTVLSDPIERGKYDECLKKERGGAAGQPDPPRPGFSAITVLNALRWIGYFPLGWILAYGGCSTLCVIGGRLLGSWTVPAALLTFLFGMCIPSSAAMLGLRISPRADRVVKWVMLFPAVLILPFAGLALFGLAWNVPEFISGSFPAISSRTQQIFISLGFLAGFVVVAVQSPDAIAKA